MIANTLLPGAFLTVFDLTIAIPAIENPFGKLYQDL